MASFLVSFILNNRRKFGRASDRGCEADIWIVDCGIWFSYIWNGIKPERKCVDFRLMLGLFLFVWGIPLLSDYNSVLRSLVSVWFYFYIHFHYRIRFNGFQYEIRFWWSVNGFWYENRIENKSSPSLSCRAIR